jgi:(p)ppGpp synthase/HD superfamily hydrolase
MNDMHRVLQAASFAAFKHRGQARKGSQRYPYINHPIAVAELLAGVGGVTDPVILMGAMLHDTVEDTSTTFAELQETFGAEVAELVREVTDDKRLPKEVRKQRQIEHAPGASLKAKILKLGDKSVNVYDVIHDPPSEWTVMRRREYVEWAVKVVAGCRGVNEALERHFDALVATGRESLKRR